MAGFWGSLLGYRDSQPEPPRPNFPRSFGFERGSVQLITGELFRPDTDAAERWVAPPTIDDLSNRCDHRILYQLHDGQFVEIAYRDCRCGQRNGREFWVSDDPPEGWIVGAREAAEFLLRCQIALPPQLELVLKQEPTASERGDPVPTIEDGDAHARRRLLAARRGAIQAVDFRRTIQRIIPQGVRFVQFLRNPPPYWENRTLWVCGEFYASLAAVHPVDLKTWSADSGVPPESVSLLDWTWPPEYAEIQRLLKQLLEVCEPALGCLWQASTTGRVSPWSPSDDELDEARNALIARLPEIESMIAEVRRLFQTFASGDGSPVRAAPTTPLHSSNSPREQTPDAATSPPSAPELAAKIVGLREQCRLALEGFEAARSALAERPSVTRVTDEMAYEWLREHRSGTEPLPSFETWARYLREARKELGVQKNRPRRGRTGRSVRKADDLK